ncbi:Molybdenum cofactor synthesis domain protein [uncultured delta proteobacterium]|uniref:Molybdopterin molybdenumtransferase n=1 Tax=uncultured delta proteobacterium TaxID=34034 RepID=A0A212K9X8_9DELT|nr:Molybdenum cofactor synthesis domain protein [uncultured delta proteobacterium]
MERKMYLKLATVDEAKALLFGHCAASPLGREAVPLEKAHGRILAEPAAAAVSSPAFHGAAMDGIAVRAEETFGASERRPKRLRIGQDAHWINTGHALPAGCNAVIMVEHVNPDRFHAADEAVFIEKAAFPWQHVRKLGEDMVATEILLPPGTEIGAYELGALAAAGVLRPCVFTKPVVAIIPSGSELVPLEDATPGLLAAGEKLPEFNSLTLAALVRDAGGEPVVLPIVPDEPERIREALLAAVASGADMVVVNAGSSAGSKDYTAGIIEEAGELWVHGVAMMPGKPTAIGRVSGKPVLGVPGYPVSAILSFEAFGQPLLALWQSRSMPERAIALARPFQALPSKPGMEEFVRVKLGKVGSELIAVPLPRGAGTVSSLSRADGIIRIDRDAEGVAEFTPSPVSLIRTREHIDGSLLAIGSHDNTLDLLDSILRKEHPGYSLTSAHVGSLGGLTALKNGRCHLAGSHLLGSDGVYNKEAVAAHLAAMPVHAVRLVDRVQGLMVLPGNPHGITSMGDLAREDVTFINRQRGSGTRVLLDWRLRELGIKPHAVQGYFDEEYTHMNVAAAVLSGRAATGLGVQAAASALGLEFIPVGVEEYDLIIPGRYWDDARIRALLDVVRSAAFKQAVANLGGYGVARTGEVLWTTGECAR